MASSNDNKERVVVVMDGNPLHDWYAMFDGCKLADGSNIHVVQGSWDKISITVYDGKGNKVCSFLKKKLKEV